MLRRKRTSDVGEMLLTLISSTFRHRLAFLPAANAGVYFDLPFADAARTLSLPCHCWRIASAMEVFRAAIARPLSAARRGDAPCRPFAARSPSAPPFVDATVWLLIHLSAAFIRRFHAPHNILPAIRLLHHAYHAAIPPPCATPTPRHATPCCRFRWLSRFHRC